MRRPGVQLTHELLVEEARFILRTLRREDLFGERVRLTEAERVIDSSISLNFADYCAFLNKFGYVRTDQLTNLIEVTEGGALVAQDMDDAEFHARIAKHFQRELGGGAPVPQASVRPLAREPAAALQEPTALVRAARPAPAAAERAGSSAAGDDVLDRRYKRGAAIGTGTLGVVFGAQHVSLLRRFAIKEARSIFQLASYLRRDEIVRRIRTTVEAHASLVHPNIIQIVDQNPEREYPYFVMEHAGGGNLRQRLAAEADGQLPLSFAVRVLLQLSYALQYAHKQGVLHLGLKPENVLFDHLGNVKLSDFGFARVTERTDDSAQTTVLVGGGSVGYMSPERLQPKQGEAVGPAADIYGLGMLFYEMITGKLPGRRSPLPSSARKEVPAGFDDVFDRMTKDELSERYSSIDDVLEGVYKAFPQKEVFVPGTVVLWAVDPKPLPMKEPEVVPVPEPAESSPPEKVRTLVEPSETKTGEIEIVSDERPQPGAFPARRRPPPPPPPPPGPMARKRGFDE